MKTLTVDLGNTHIKYAIFSHDHILETHHFSSQTPLNQWESQINWSHTLDRIVIANVSQHDDEIVDHFFSSHTKLRPYFVNAKQPWPFQHQIQQPETLGADRIAHMSFVNDFKTNCLVLDLGTFLTVDYFDSHFGFFGGLIFPGVMTAKNIYKEKASRLKDFMITVSNSCYGTQTESAMQTGLYNGYKHILKGFIEDFKHLSKNELQIFATGGGYSLFQHEFSNIHFEPHLNHKGLLKWVKWYEATHTQQKEY